MAKFAINNKTHLTTKVSLFMVNYERYLRIEMNIRRKGKVEKAVELMERMEKVQEKVGATLRKAQ